jgi:hypothetical protein
MTCLSSQTLLWRDAGLTGRGVHQLVGVETITRQGWTPVGRMDDTDAAGMTPVGRDG